MGSGFCCGMEGRDGRGGGEVEAAKGTLVWPKARIEVQVDGKY